VVTLDKRRARRSVLYGSQVDQEHARAVTMERFQGAKLRQIEVGQAIALMDRQATILNSRAKTLQAVIEDKVYAITRGMRPANGIVRMDKGEL
jgi:hypothetical protein